MNPREFEILRLRFVEGKRFKEMVSVIGVSSQRIRQIYNQAIQKMIYAVEMDKWKKQSGLSNVSDRLLTLVYLLGPELHLKIRNIIRYWGIKEPEDFRQHDLNNLRMKSMGPITGLRIKLVLLKMEIPYDKDDMETIERKLLKLTSRADSGLQLRFKILNRDGFKCQYCGRSPKEDQSVILNVDHIRPISLGGSHEEKNLITSCRECNLGKGDMII